MHVSLPVDNTVEFINVVPLNPLISKCQIKVCYVGDEPNRNRSVITKDVAREMANSLPGCPIVGYYNKEQKDFEEHNKTIDISNGKFVITDTTVPYGFVDLGAKVWFQKFVDDGMTEREYMVTEGYIWTGQFPEAQRIFEQGNNQSMELDEETLNTTWAKDENGNLQFFIINEAIISKLCILGEGFKEKLFSMIEEVKELLLNKEGEQKMENKEKVVVEEEVIETAEFTAEEESSTEPESQFKKEDKKEKEEENSDENGQNDSNDKEEDSDDKEGEKEEEPKEETTEEEDDKNKKKKYSLEEIPEYTELLAQHDQLKTDFASLEAEVATLREFKENIELDKKQEMINSFYMLSDEDKKEVVDNIKTYSLEKIEEKLSVICVRNKVSFALEEEKPDTTFNLETESVPADSWIAAVKETQKNM